MEVIFFLIVFLALIYTNTSTKAYAVSADGIISDDFPNSRITENGSRYYKNTTAVHNIKLNKRETGRENFRTRVLHIIMYRCTRHTRRVSCNYY